MVFHRCPTHSREDVQQGGGGQFYSPSRENRESELAARLIVAILLSEAVLIHVSLIFSFRPLHQVDEGAEGWRKKFVFLVDDGKGTYVLTAVEFAGDELPLHHLVADGAGGPPAPGLAAQ